MCSQFFLMKVYVCINRKKLILDVILTLHKLKTYLITTQPRYSTLFIILEPRAVIEHLASHPSHHEYITLEQLASNVTVLQKLPVDSKLYKNI